MKLLLSSILPLGLLCCAYGTAQTETHNQSADSLFMEATSLFLTEKNEEALNGYIQLRQLQPENAAAAYQIARLYVGSKQYSLALLYAEMACGLDPKNEWYLLQAAQLHKVDKNFVRAAEIYRQLQELRPDKLDFCYDEANMWILSGNTDAATDVYNRLETRYGITDDWTMQKYKIHMNTGNEKAARNEIEKISKAMPHQSKYLQMLAQMCLQNKEYKAAYNYLKKVEEINPDDPYNQIALADYHRTTGDFKSAFTRLMKAVKNPGLDFSTKMNVIQTYYAGKDELSPKGNLDAQAVDLFEALIETHPNEPQGYFSYARYLTYTDRGKQATPLLQKAVMLEPGVYPAWDMLMMIYANIADTANLTQTALRAAERFPEQPAPFFYLSYCSFIREDYYQSIDYALQALEKNPAGDRFIEETCLNILGDAYHKTKQYGLTLQTYEKLMELNPKDPGIRNNYAYFIALYGTELDKAELLGWQLCKEFPDNPTYLDTYGWVLYRKGQYAKAAGYIKAAVQKTGQESAEVYMHYGDVLFRLQQTDKARMYWQKALNICPDKETRTLIENKLKEPEKWID